MWKRLVTVAGIGVSSVVMLITAASSFAQAPDTPAAPESSASEETTADDPFADSGLDQLDLSRLVNPQVRSASLIAEPISEAPAPVTVITARMIETIGARNLQEILAYYVPGMTIVSEKNEMNIAMRGIYTDSQQKILVLVDGHRINSRLYSSAAPDFSIGIHPSKIEQIEVLRGPGSAIYGNLALNGVINIVTKEASAMKDAVVELGVGTMGQRMLNATGAQVLGEDSNVKVWASLYEADGDVVDITADEEFNKIDDPEPQAYIGRFRDPASFDIGGRLTLGDVALSVNARQGKMVPPFTAGGNLGGQTYDYDAFRSWNGVKPGLMSRSVHSELSFDRKLTDWLTFHSGLYFDTNETQQRLVIETQTSGADENVSAAIGWSEQTIGNLSHLTMDFDLGAVGAGSFVVGGQIDHVEVVDSYWITGSNGDLKTINGTADEKMLPDGNETIFSAFTQLKHAMGWNRDIIFNLGVRYDYKDRHDYLFENDFTMESFEVGDDIFAISPRLALIFAPDSWFGLKMSFSDSFVDAPYFNRTNRTRNFRGTPTLEPEKMRAYQITPSIRAFGDRFKNSTNFYYLEHSDIIFRKKTLDPGETLFQNSGELIIGGVENETTFLAEDYRIRANASFQKPLHWTVYPVTDGQIDNIPQFSASAVIDFKPLFWMTNDVWLSLSGRYYSEQTSPVDIFYIVQRAGRGVPAITREFDEPDNRVDDYLLLRAVLRWNDIGETDFYGSLTVDNILDTTYFQGGTTSHPYRQAGRWVMARVGYNFDL